MPKGIKGFQKGHKNFGGFKEGHKGFRTKESYENFRGKHLSPETEFKKGNTPWSKGKKIPKISGKNHYFWKGGKVKHTEGYIQIYNPKHPFAKNGKYVLEHRLIVEKIIGRYLTPEEEVHHLGKRDDNRPQMLMVFINQSSHQRFEQNGIVKPEEIIFDGRKLNQ